MLYCLLPRSHYLPASLPPLSFSDTEKLTPPPPSLLLALPPFLQWQTDTILFLLCVWPLYLQFTFPSQTPHRASPSASSHPFHHHLLLFLLLVSKSVLMLFCSLHWKLVLPKNPLHAAFPPLYSLFTPSLTLPPLSLSITPWEPTCFPLLSISCCLHLPHPIFIYVLIRLSYSDFICISTYLDTSLT